MFEIHRLLHYNLCIQPYTIAALIYHFLLL
jgi:hypothetical protein